MEVGIEEITEPRKKEEEDVLGIVLARLQKFDRKKLEQLIATLDKIEAGEAVSSSSVQIPNTIKEPSPNKQKNTYELVFRIISTWGHPHVVGITELQIFDKAGNRLFLPCIARNTGIISMQPIGRLTNGAMYTTDENKCGVAYLPLPPKSLELVYYLPKDKRQDLGGIAIWNYNKNSSDSVKGVKKAEIELEGKILWSGIINRGQGNNGENYSTEIPLSDSQMIFKNKPQPPEIRSSNPSIESQSEKPGRPITVPAPIWLLGDVPSNPTSQKGITRKEIPDTTKQDESKSTETKASKEFRSPFEQNKKSRRMQHEILSSFPQKNRDRSIEKHIDNLPSSRHQKNKGWVGKSESALASINN